MILNPKRNRDCLIFSDRLFKKLKKKKKKKVANWIVQVRNKRVVKRRVKKTK